MPPAAAPLPCPGCFKPRQLLRQQVEQRLGWRGGREAPTQHQSCGPLHKWIHQGACDQHGMRAARQRQPGHHGDAETGLDKPEAGGEMFRLIANSG